VNLRCSLCCVLLTAGPTAGFAPADAPLMRFSYEETHMGTLFKVIVYAGEEAAAQRAGKAAFARIADLDRIMSDYRQTSELMQLCEKSGGAPVPVSRDLFHVLSRGQELSTRSDGAFDVTVGPIVKLWRRVRLTKMLPSDEQLAEVKALVGYTSIKLDKEKQTVQLLKKGMKLDLGGIAKGYAAEQALEVLKKAGLTRALVAAGGDIVAGEPPPGEAGWQVGIRPLEPGDKQKDTVVLKNAAVSTSGDAEQFLEINGERYSHIVDPRTGLGLRGRISVTVLATEGSTSDSLATALNVLGPERGLKLIEDTPGAAALFIRKTDQGTETFKSKRWPGK
jgi:thiamine biosynthesis lipoprotein